MVIGRSVSFSDPRVGEWSSPNTPPPKKKDPRNIFLAKISVNKNFQALSSSYLPLFVQQRDMIVCPIHLKYWSY